MGTLSGLLLSAVAQDGGSQLAVRFRAPARFRFRRLPFGLRLRALRLFHRGLAGPLVFGQQGFFFELPVGMRHRPCERRISTFRMFESCKNAQVRGP